MLNAAPILLLVALLGSPYDLLIRNGTVVDGSGSPAFRADVAIRDGRIARIGDLKGASARRTLDASGLVVAPGFIDVHTHADDLAKKPRAENFLRMGVTTIVAGNCGSSAVDIGKELEEIRRADPSINFATLVGHGSVRSAVMGMERRAPTAAELEKMKALAARAMADGAVGLSTGLQYVPGSYAAEDEIVELARVACRAGGLYASHMRNEGDGDREGPGRDDRRR
jgi:N-acyl-D-amino-acid deacylase